MQETRGSKPATLDVGMERKARRPTPYGSIAAETASDRPPLGPWGGLTADCAPRLARLPIKAIGWWVASSAPWTPSPSSNMQVPLAARQRLPEIEGVMKPTASENTDFQHPGALFHFLRTRVVVRLLLPGPSKRRRALVWWSLGAGLCYWGGGGGGRPVVRGQVWRTSILAWPPRASPGADPKMRNVHA